MSYDIYQHSKIILYISVFVMQDVCTALVKFQNFD